MYMRLFRCVSSLVLCCAPLVVWAETLSVFNVPFDLDSVTEVDDATVKVTLFGESKILAKEMLQDFVVRGNISKRGLKALGNNQNVMPWVKAVLANGKDSWASLLLSKLPDFSYEQQSGIYGDLIESIAGYKNGSEILQSAIHQMQPTMANPIPACLVALYASRSEIDMVKSGASGWIYKYQDSCLDAVRIEFFRFVKAGKAATAERLLASSAALYGTESEQVRTLLMIATKVKKIDDMIEGGDFLGIERALTYLGDPETEKVLRENASQHALEKIKGYLDSAKRDEALSLIPFLNFEKRTPYQHELVKNSLLNRKDLRGFIHQKPVMDMLLLFAGKDDQIRNQVLHLLDRTALEFVKNGDSGNFENILSMAKSIRPDPSEENDSLRVAWVLKLLKYGDRYAAHEYMNQVGTAVSVDQRFKLLTSGMYIDTRALFLVLLLSLGSPLVYFLVRERAFQVLARRFPHIGRRSIPDPEHDEKKQQFRRFVTQSRTSAADEPDEYRELLALFGLQSPITMQQIKMAYRNAVKECHPDMNPHAGEAENARFISLTRSYERLVELHRGKGG